MNFFEESLQLHKNLKGKIGLENKLDIGSAKDLSLVYSPGVAQPCIAITNNPEDVYTYTIKSNSVAVVTDGSAVLGLGNIGPHAAIPVMEGKAMLFKKFAGIDAFPICLDTQVTEEIIKTIIHIAPVFGGINLEDIAAPRCFEIEDRLQNLGIPVFHDDQHGTAIVVLAALLNAAKVVRKDMRDLKVVINGAGAAGIAIARLLKCNGRSGDGCVSVKDVIVCDSKEIIQQERLDLTKEKLALLQYTNQAKQRGTLRDALVEADVFIGVSKGNLLTAADIQLMAKDAIIFALANPVPEIMPEEAYKGGAAVVGTGRSDLLNQINNVLCFPGIFRGAFDARAPQITMKMKLAAAITIAECIHSPKPEKIIPSVLDLVVTHKVAEAVKQAALQEK